MKTAAH